MDCPKLRSVEAFPVNLNGQRLICLRDPYNFSEKVVFLPPPAFFVVSLLDGRHSLLDIQEAFMRRFGEILFNENIEQLLRELEGNYLLEGPAFQQRKQQVEEEFRLSNLRLASHAGLSYPKEAGEIRKQLENLLNSCVAGLKKMSAERGLLLLFDTAEQFVYPSQRGARFAPAWDWLKSWIGDLSRGAVLFAGRPDAEPLLLQISLPQLHHMPLAFFSPEESRAYLLATAERWSREKGTPFSFAEEDIQRLHVLSQGRPILLAIFLELRMRDPQAFKDLSDLQPENFEHKIIDYLMSQPELGESLKAAGRAPKGINAALLSKIRGISVREAEQALEALNKMSFAKTFPDDERVFLNHEMYALLERYVYFDDADAAERQVAAQAIYYYCKQEINQKDEALKEIYARLTQEVDFRQSDLSVDFSSKIRALETSRQELKAEFLYYRLRHQIEKKERKAYQDDPIQAGLKNYYRFGHEAATSNNDEILIPLQIELTTFWLRLEDGNFWKPFIEGLLLVHEVWLKLATGQAYWAEIHKHEKSLEGIADLTANQRTILDALLGTWLGTGLVFAKKPEYDRAEQIFTQAIDSMQNVLVDQRLQWFKDVVTSLAYRQRAYMRSNRGAFQDAIEDFQKGLRYSRAVDFFHEEATLRNDLGFAQLQKGVFQSAFENMWDGLQLRYRVAIGPRIALSHSSLAQHFISTGAFEEAHKHARYAIRVAEAVGYRRGLGFGNLALAEATRRFAFSAQGPSNQAEYLQVAQDSIEIAVHLLEQLGEKARIIDSKLEEACLYRNRVRIETEPSKKKIWFEKSSKQLLEVAKAAEEAGIEYRLVDAMCNRVWLGYFADDLDYADQAAREFEALEVLNSYWLKDGIFADEVRAQKNPILWSQIGKYCMARGVIALDRWKKEKKDESLRTSARHIMLGMTYSTKFASDHRGLREGRRTIYQALAPLNPEELKQFCRYVLEAEESEKIPQTPSALQVLMKDHALWFED